jgi:hypothetical protein
MKDKNLGMTTGRVRVTNHQSQIKKYQQYGRK